MAKRGQPRNICWFCGRPGASREHILARWIAGVLDPRVLGATVRYHHYSENPDAGIRPTHKVAGGPAYFSRRFFCSCNSGWMARLEQQVRPVLEPLILGRARVISSADCRILALWAAKTVLAFQTIEHATKKKLALSLSESKLRDPEAIRVD